jgi:hypothetical protein
MEDLLAQLALGEIPRQQIIVFESKEEAYVAICPMNSMHEVIMIARINGAKSALESVRQSAGQ